MGAAYDPAILVRYADDLYRRAESMVLGATIAFGLTGFAGGFVGGTLLARNTNMAGLFGSVAALILGLTGFYIGQQRAFSLRLEA